MALTYNEYIGDGSTTVYSFTFPYMDSADVKVSLDVVDTTEFTFENATTLRMNTAPDFGVRIKIYRQTDQSALEAVFYSGSAIRAQDLNDNFNQIIYIAQESDDDSSDADTDAKEALILAEQALEQSSEAIDISNEALTKAANAELGNQQAISDANLALTNSATALASAEHAEDIANTAMEAVSAVLPSTIVSNVASIPSSPVDQEVVEVVDSTGLESFTPLTGLPADFIGDPGLSVKIQWDEAGATWRYLSSTPNNSDERYVKKPDSTVTTADETDTVVLYRSGTTHYITKADWQAGLETELILSSLPALP